MPTLLLSLHSLFPSALLNYPLGTVFSYLTTLAALSGAHEFC